MPPARLGGAEPDRAEGAGKDPELKSPRSRLTSSPEKYFSFFFFPFFPFLQFFFFAGKHPAGKKISQRDFLELLILGVFFLPA